MEFGKPSEALLSKSYTVALLYLSAAAAEKMKEAEVVKKKKKKLGVGEGSGVGRPPHPGWENTQHNLLLHTRVFTQKRDCLRS